MHTLDLKLPFRNIFNFYKLPDTIYALLQSMKIISCALNLGRDRTPTAFDEKRA